MFCNEIHGKAIQYAQGADIGCERATIYDELRNDCALAKTG